MALDATVGGASATSYVSQATADAYLGDRLDSDAWEDAASDEKDAALMMATARLDIEPYAGARTTITQRLSWPRYDVRVDGQLLASDTIPVVVEQATIEYALALLREPTLLNDTGLSGFLNVKVGSLDVTPRNVTAPPMPDFVRRLLAQVRIGGSGVHVARA